jgi:hypothetical protein
MNQRGAKKPFGHCAQLVLDLADALQARHRRLATTP